MSRDRKVIEKVIASLRNIGQFEISPLREGRDGACFRAVDPNRRISVAIHTVWPSDYENGEEYAQKLTGQARAAQSLDHGNIAKVIGSGELDGAFFIVSSWVDGRSLRQNLQNSGNLNVWDLIDFARQSCTGLESAHSRGIIHHALHPDNIVLEFDGSTKVLDLGLFRSNIAGFDPFHPNACYLAPEQLAGHGADRVTNFYNIAVMLYEAATGKLPFTGEDWESLKFASEAELVEPVKLVPQLPPGINAAIVKALQRDRSARYASGPEMVRALEDYKNFGKPMIVATPKPKVVSIDGGAAAAAPVRNPYATAPDLAPAMDPRLDTASDQRSNVGVERPAMLGSLESSGVWKRPVEGPPPASVVQEDHDAPYVDPPKASAQIKDFAARLGLELWAVISKQLKRLDPWAVALSGLVIILALFISRTLILSFYPPQPENYDYNRAIQPPPKPQPAPVQTAPEPQQTEPATAPSKQTTAAPVVEETSGPTPSQKTVRVKTPPPPGPAVFSAAKPLPASGVVVTSTGMLELTSTPTGARVTIDGKASPVYTTPAVIPSLAPGVHTFTISKDGYSPATRPVQITAGVQSHLNVQLDLPSGFLTVLSTPSTAYILVDGVNTGHVTPSQIPVAPGTHTVTLRKFGYLETSDSFTLKSGEQQSRNVTLLEAGSTPDIRVVQSSGVHKVFGNKVQGVRIAVHTNPPGATVYISGQQVGKATPVEFGLNPGGYAMEIQLAGHPTVKKNITVEAGKPLVLDETLP
ncbi:serine/threonine protein kinase [Candidatus Koribacter versatilis Ellin345]|uniref:Serine/threonine protein kinase n=1 Tax=Koribacter versatilis (strain Ellin345) TaxID=204669 RepID=Q1IN67_KORVE|nr:serine/threonine-protein kinase [Candidatus Koribacter versatilis]ABF41683.1 serine/threonine protein kinase [Candidatus Koribacter versatilis Ellin345]